MKYYFFFFLILFLSCKTTSHQEQKISMSDPIVYIFPGDVTAKIYQQLIKDSSKVLIYLSTFDQYYMATISKINHNDIYAKKTNRVVFIHGNFFPLVLVEDMIFGTTLTKSETLKKIQTDPDFLVPKEYTIAHGWNIKFNSKGEIL